MFKVYRLRSGVHKRHQHSVQAYNSIQVERYRAWSEYICEKLITISTSPGQASSQYKWVDQIWPRTSQSDDCEQLLLLSTLEDIIV